MFLFEFRDARLERRDLGRTRLLGLLLRLGGPLLEGRPLFGVRRLGGFEALRERLPIGVGESVHLVQLGGDGTAFGVVARGQLGELLLRGRPLGRGVRLGLGELRDQRALLLLEFGDPLLVRRRATLGRRVRLRGQPRRLLRPVALGLLPHLSQLLLEVARGRRRRRASKLGASCLGGHAGLLGLRHCRGQLCRGGLAFGERELLGLGELYGELLALAAEFGKLCREFRALGGVSRIGVAQLVQLAAQRAQQRVVRCPLGRGCLFRRGRLLGESRPLRLGGGQPVGQGSSLAQRGGEFFVQPRALGLGPAGEFREFRRGQPSCLVHLRRARLAGLVHFRGAPLAGPGPLPPRVDWRASFTSAAASWRAWSTSAAASWRAVVHLGGGQLTGRPQRLARLPPVVRPASRRAGRAP